jgi:hypothetical protein
MVEPDPAANPATTGLAEGCWWLIVWSTAADQPSAAIPLGARRDWTRDTLRMLSTYWRETAEVVDESTPWGRIYLHMPDVVIYAPGYSPPPLATAHERALAVNVVWRTDEIAKTSVAEAWLAIRGELLRRDSGRGAGRDGETDG